MNRPGNGRALFKRASQAFAETQACAKDWASDARTFIRKRPLLSALLGLAAGLALGFIARSGTPKVELVVRSKGGPS